MTFALPNTRPQILRAAFWAVLLIGFPLILAVCVLGIWSWDLSIPLIYRNSDDIWQLTLTKVLHDTGWILTNPYLGAPEVASWHHNAAAQTSALHSVMMLALSPLIQEPVRLQQIYYLLNFPLICLTSFIACRLLGVSRLLAFCVGLLFAFTTYRIDEMLYAFLTNYFMVPLALVAVIWVLSGKFAALIEEQKSSTRWWHGALSVVRTREFTLGLFFVALAAAADGYYAFFTLLLLGFAAFVRVLLGDWRRPLSLLPVGIYIFALMAVTLSLMLPLHNYKKTHRQEFFPNGVEDAALIKQPFEAEVYSSTLKMLIAPIQQHRIEFLGKVGKRMVETSDGARLFKNGRTLVPLGTLGSMLFGVALTMLAVPALRRSVFGALNPRGDPALGDSLLSLTLFIFLCSILGGIGTLVALVFPTIRGYDRFPLFMIFVLYLGAAWFITLKMGEARWLSRTIWTALILLGTATALYDQIPRNASKGDQQSKKQFLAERHFVQNVEAALPPNAMVYQYPYSQYLRLNKYYGWGSFSHIRLYLHSHQLHWSNGGAKNSPADDWNFRISQLPLDNLIAEVEAVGFSGFVIDGTVVKSGEYESMRRAFASKGYEVLEDASSKYTFVRLRDPGFRLVYDPTYREADRIVVTDPTRLARSELPELIEGEALRRFITGQADKSNSVIRKADHPEIFADGAALARGRGQAPIAPISDMRGRMGCKVEAGTETGGASDTLLLTVENQSSFDWKLGDGPFPIRIGVHLLQPDGKLLRWDDGFRVPTDAYIRRGASSTIRLPINTVPLGAEVKGSSPLVAEFALVQDSNAWFGNVSCTVPLR
jgi:hypothetical protein